MPPRGICLVTSRPGPSSPCERRFPVRPHPSSLSVRDTLADVPDERLVELGERWAESDEDSMFGAEPAQLAELIAELRGLARRARDEGQLIYCWSSL